MAPGAGGACSPTNFRDPANSASMAAGLSYPQNIDTRTQAQIDADAQTLGTIASVMTGGLSGLGAKASVNFCEAAVKSSVGVSKKGLKHLKKHTNDFKQFDPNFSVGDQVDLGKSIARDQRNLIDNRYGGRGYKKNVNINGNNVTVRTLVNSSNNLRNVYPVKK